jgi:hypothetical protein
VHQTTFSEQSLKKCKTTLKGFLLPLIFVYIYYQLSYISLENKMPLEIGKAKCDIGGKGKKKRYIKMTLMQL